MSEDLTKEEMADVKEEIRKQVRETIQGQGLGIVVLIEEILEVFQNNEELIDDILSLIADTLFKAYEAYIKSGFTKDQAFQLTAQLSQHLNKGMGVKKK